MDWAWSMLRPYRLGLLAEYRPVGFLTGKRKVYEFPLTP
jgi:hypothetical protein